MTKAKLKAKLVDDLDNDVAVGSQEEVGGELVAIVFESVLRKLRQPIEPRLIKSREGWTDHDGNTHFIEYVEWHTVADILDRVTPNWSHAVRSIQQIGDLVAVIASITIENVTREGVGTGEAGSEIGIKKAEHDALKRAAIKFGIARDLYQRESDVIYQQIPARSEKNGFPKEPLARTLADLITPRQINLIRAIGRNSGLDIEQECQALLGCPVEGISKRAASCLIDYLLRKQQEGDSQELRQAS
ncbi:MAG: RAD52 family DNA repair protein [Acidobacteria bacterium]|nr:RAD52 family DNA repair protein [Acidobacteriota bacterium]